MTPKTLATAVLLSVPLTTIGAVPFSQGMVSITFDDGYVSHLTVARPLLEAHGYRGTFYLFTDALQGWSYTLTTAQARQIAAGGHEIGSHSVSHPDLTTLTDSALDAELAQSQVILVRDVGVPDVPNLALPYGAYDARVLSYVARYYLSSRTTHEGYVYKDTDPLQLPAFGCQRDLPLSSLTAVVDQALANKSWAILYFHDIKQSPAGFYDCSIDNLTGLLDYLVQRGAKVVTVGRGIEIMKGLPDSGASLGTLTLQPSQVVGGATTTGTLTIPTPTRSNLTVSLWAEDPRVVVPATVTVPAGRSKATFSVTTKPVAVAIKVDIDAIAGSSAATGLLQVRPVTVSGLALSPASVVGGASSTATVTLTGAAPAGGLLVALSSSAAGAAAVPTNVSVPAGKTSATFTVATSPVASRQTVIISASAGGSSYGSTITVNAPAVSSLSLSASLVLRGTTVTGTVKLTGAASAGGTVVILSASPTSVTVPASITVPAGATSASFTVQTGSAGSFTSATISATAGGLSKSAGVFIL